MIDAVTANDPSMVAMVTEVLGGESLQQWERVAPRLDAEQLAVAREFVTAKQAESAAMFATGVVVSIAAKSGQL